MRSKKSIRFHESNEAAGIPQRPRSCFGSVDLTPSQLWPNRELLSLVNYHVRRHINAR